MIVMQVVKIMNRIEDLKDCPRKRNETQRIYMGFRWVSSLFVILLNESEDEYMETSVRKNAWAVEG